MKIGALRGFDMSHSHCSMLYAAVFAVWQWMMATPERRAGGTRRQIQSGCIGSPANEIKSRFPLHYAFLAGTSIMYVYIIAVVL